MTKDNNFLAYLYLFLTVTFWAGNFVVGKLASLPTTKFPAQKVTVKNR